MSIPKVKNFKPDICRPKISLQISLVLLFILPSPAQLPVPAFSGPFLEPHLQGAPDPSGRREGRTHPALASLTESQG